MTEPRHTPGPWQFYVPAEWDDVKRDAKQYAPRKVFRISASNEVRVRRPESGYIGLVFKSHPNEPDPTEANVRIMATAPELLAACKAAEAFIGGDGDPVEQAVVLRLLNAVIAKATEADKW